MDLKQYMGHSAGPWEMMAGSFADYELVSADGKTLIDLDVDQATHEDLQILEYAPDIVSFAQTVQSKLRKVIREGEEALHQLRSGDPDEARLILSRLLEDDVKTLRDLAGLEIEEHGTSG